MTNAATALAIVLPKEQLDDALQLFTDEQAEQFALLATRVNEIADRVPTGKVESDRQAREVERLMSASKDALAQVEAKRKEIVGPLNEQVKAVNDLFRPLTAALGGVKEKCDPLVLAWIKAKQQEQERARLEAERVRIEAERREVEARIAAENARTEEERREQITKASDAMQEQAFAKALVPAPIHGLASASSSHTLTRRWVATVSKPADLPREYLMPNQAAIDEALAAAVRKMRAEGREVPELEIPGVTLEEKESLRKGRGVY